ncbi:MAG: hypothetical protein GTO45_28165 [Candidatus Aminicenantes bacterium]|nr:hypothetical protein [Candidatus Aminicenantes bacterium]NIM82676.1 hypothetical protein [Candidatus Aminicenantes bacterium]NIN22049.1 hypothetical protein [Candidatus Aminicenantes bacterium]NIN45806.1 hypothetical protein [Candidatus Aminicenantes bacterium]NIN88644.1 hypothetical protein [Candidatus Aminicenantes bacterium]
MNWDRATYPEKIDGTEVMIEGLGLYKVQLETFGVSEEKINLFIAQKDKTIKKNAIQEQFKAALKEATADLEAELEILGDMFKEFKKIIKFKMPQETWKACGIQDKK